MWIIVGGFRRWPEARAGVFVQTRRPDVAGNAAGLCRAGPAKVQDAAGTLGAAEMPRSGACNAEDGGVRRERRCSDFQAANDVDTAEQGAPRHDEASCRRQAEIWGLPCLAWVIGGRHVFGRTEAQRNLVP